MDLAITPRRPLQRQLRRGLLNRLTHRRRPRPPRRQTLSDPTGPAIPARPRDPSDLAETVSESLTQDTELLATLRGQERAMPIKDSLIAATALAHDLAVATLNRRDFDAAGVAIVDPLSEPDD